jgi:uncharacterized protein YjcR
MPIKEEDSTIIKPITKADLASKYGISSKVFRSWCKKAGFDFGQSEILTPNQVKQCYDHFGPPEIYYNY